VNEFQYVFYHHLIFNTKMNIIKQTLYSLGFYLGAALLFSSVLSCTSDKKQDSEEENLTTIVEQETTQESSEIEATSQVAEFDPEVYDGFLLGTWEYDLIIDANVEEPMTDMKGKKLVFNSDYTYSIKDGKKIEDSGKFKYNRTGGIITLLSEKGTNSEWSSNYQGSGPMILIGTSTYGNNARQMRLFEVLE
jgi:hypothetical protein